MFYIWISQQEDFVMKDKIYYLHLKKINLQLFVEGYPYCKKKSQLN